MYETNSSLPACSQNAQSRKTLITWWLWAGLISHRGALGYGVFHSLKQGDIWDLTFEIWVWNWDQDGLEEQLTRRKIVLFIKTNVLFGSVS